MVLVQGPLPTEPNTVFLPWVSNSAPETTAANGLPPIYISEFMAANHATLHDEDGESSDRLEIANASTNPVNLQGWNLTDDAKKLTKWKFPSVIVAAGGYLLVFASHKDRTSDPAHLHTNFNLGRYGGYLALVKADGKTIAWQYTSNSAEQYPDVSYGVDNAGQAR